MKLSILFISALILSSCNKEPDGPATPSEGNTGNLSTLPLSGSSEISLITSTSAHVVSTTINDGQTTVTSRGIMYGKIISTDTILDSTIYNGGGVGNFTNDLTNLSSSTHYFVKVFSTNAVGTHIGKAKLFYTN
jgi:hypothetical protein